MDDNRVAQLLATTLAIEGQASARLATVFNTIATDDDRKARVLSLTRRMLSETDFGRQDAFQSLWSSMEELLLTYNEKPFVSRVVPGRAGPGRAAGPSRWRPTCRRISSRCWTRSDRTTSGGCRCGC